MITTPQWLCPLFFPEMKRAIYEEISDRFGHPEKQSSYFEHRLKELAEELANKVKE